MKYVILLILPIILLSYGFPNIMEADGAPPIILHTEKKEYVMGEPITLNGIVKFVNDKAVGIGLPRDLSVAIEVYDSKNSFIESHILKAKNDDTFVLTLDTGDNSKISKNGQYHFVAYYGLVNSKLLNSDYVGRHDVHVGENVLSSPTVISPIPSTSPNSTPTNPPMNWTAIAGLLIVVGFVAIIVVKKLGLLGGESIPRGFSRKDKLDFEERVRSYSSSPTSRPYSINNKPSSSNMPNWAKSYTDTMRETSPQAKTHGSPRSRNEIDEKDLRNHFSRFDGFEMEKIVGKLFEKKGYSVKVTQKTQDYGIDVWATKTGVEKIGIQVKHVKGNVGFEDVAKTMGVSDQASKVMVISTKSGFTQNSMKFQREKSYRLVFWDLNQFASEIRQNMQNGIFKIN